MPELSNNCFVAAAMIASKLDMATQVALKLSLTASNACALTLRAGQSAAGFKPLTQAIQRLADITVKSSQKINSVAIMLSKLAVEKHRAEQVLIYFGDVYEQAKNSPHLTSLDVAHIKTKQKLAALEKDYKEKIQKLAQELGAIEGELRSIIVLKTLCHVEASQAGPLYQESLNNVAVNVEMISIKITEQIVFSRQQLATLK